MKLNDLMEFDHVIRVNDDLTITEDVPDVYAPESLINVDADGQIMPDDEREWVESIERQGWQLLNGWSGQYGYAGPIMRSSEYIGGDLARHIRETPGLYVAITVETLDDSEDAAGWAVAYRAN